MCEEHAEEQILVKNQYNICEEQAGAHTTREKNELNRTHNLCEEHADEQILVKNKLRVIITICVKSTLKRKHT